MKFKNWENTERHPFVIHEDFESLLVKVKPIEENPTKIIQQYIPMSNCYYIKVSEDVPVKLLDESFNISLNPIIFRGNISSAEDDLKIFK